MNSKLNLLLFCAAIFILATIGWVIVHVGKHVLTFWLIFAYLIAYPFIFAIFVPLLTGNGKLSGKKILLLTFSITIIAIAVTNLVWTITLPKWSFSVATDKSSYRLGEDVRITVSLKNLGFITHSFKSAVSDPVVVSVEYQYAENPTVTYQVWYNPFHRSITEFSIGPNESLERTIIWNQTNIYHPEEKIEPGSYYVTAFIPSAETTGWGPIGLDKLFSAWTSINITSA